MEFLKVTNSTDGLLSAPNRWYCWRVSIKMVIRSLSGNLLKGKVHPCFIRQWNHKNSSFACGMDSSNEDGFSLHSEIFPINDCSLRL